MPGLDAHGSTAAGPEVASSSAPVVPGRLLGSRYELIRPIARGGMAEVWEGRDETLRRSVAIKVLQTHLASDVTFVERFRREAVTAARVAHPCVVATYDAGVDAGTAFIVMELVEGQTLRQLLTASAPLAPGLAVAIAQQIADALANAHRAGLVHRDIKPANILLCDDGAGALRVKVTDFGIAKVGAEIGADLTQIGTVLGTPKYLSPEQVEGRVEPDSRSDLYSLGVVLFEMLTGRPPFNGQTAMATALSHLRDPPARVSSLRPEIGARLDAFVDRLLAKSPADRPSTALEARLELDGLVRGGLLSVPDRVSAAGTTSGRDADGRSDGSGGRSDGPGRAVGGGEERPPALSGPIGNTAWSRRRGSFPLRLRTPTVDLTDSGPLGRDATTVVRPGGRRDLPPPARQDPAYPPSGPVSGSVPPVPVRSGPASSGPPGSGPAPSGSAPSGSALSGSRSSGLAPSRSLSPGSAAPGRRRRRGRLPGLVVAGIVLIAVIVAGTLIADHGGAGNGSGSSKAGDPGPGGAATAAAVRVQAVSVWMNTTAHPPDNPGETAAIFDGRTTTAWNTDDYHGADAAQFGGLYTGEGLAIHLSTSKALARLVVDSPTKGWAASTYVAGSLPATGSAVSAWGTPTASTRAINGNVTFALGGRKGSWVLLWLTDLGPSAHASITEVTVS